jgi:hypothetical protein
MRIRLRRNLDQLEQQRAGYGELSVPLSIRNEEAAQRRVLAQIEAAIALLEPPPEVGLVVAAPDADNDELGALLGQAVQELRQEVLQFRRQVYATTLGLGQQTYALEGDLRRQITALHQAIAQTQETGILASSDTRAIVESKLGQMAAALEEARNAQETWQARETAERRRYQQQRLRWKQGLTVVVLALCVVVIVVAWRLMG